MSIPVERDGDGFRTAKLYDGDRWWRFRELSGADLLDLADLDLPEKRQGAIMAAMSLINDDSTRTCPDPASAMAWFEEQPGGRLIGLVLEGGAAVNEPEGHVDPET